MDLSKQSTFTENSLIKVWCSEDNFMLKNFQGIQFFTLWAFDEAHKGWIYCCRVDTLEELEKEYNKRSNNLFQWK